MPIYEYQCQACGHVDEIMAKMSDPPPAECTACHGGPMEKLMSRTAFILQGSGWYVTDYKKSHSTPSSAPSKSDTTSTSEPKKDGATAAPEPAKAHSAGCACCH